MLFGFGMRRVSDCRERRGGDSLALAKPGAVSLPPKADPPLAEKSEGLLLKPPP